MGNKKDNKNCIIILLIAIIIILATSMVLLSTGIISFKNGGDTSNDQQTSETNSVDSNLITKLVGTYSYKGKYVDNEADIDENSQLKEKIYEELVLNSSGEAEAKAGSVRGGGYDAKGKWYISDDEIIIINEKCSPAVIENEAIYPNCSPTWVYKYKIENSNITITSNNNTLENMTLEKIK